MGLYLTVFDGEDELEGVDVGAYADFGAFREAIAMQLEGGTFGARYPTLMLHSDCDGVWSPDEAALLERELREIADRFRQLPPSEPAAGSWQAGVARTFGLRPSNLYESFFDVDGEPLIERLLELVRVARQRGVEILFQ